MKVRGPILAMILLLVVNLIVLAGAYVNRQGRPEASLVLTERELPLAWNYRGEENSGLAFKLNWQHYPQDWIWFDERKLEELGINNRSRLAAGSYDSYYRSLPMKAFVVLEYDGPSWQEFVQQKQEELAEIPILESEGTLEPEAAERKRKAIETELRTASHLFPVDVGLDPAQLRAAYPDRAHYLITTAEVRGTTVWQAASGQEESTYLLKGRIDRILTDHIHVPRTFHTMLQEIPDGELIRSNRGYYGGDSPIRPHYQVRLDYGQRYEPWIREILPFDSAEDPP